VPSKADLREQILARRERRDPDERRAAGDSFVTRVVDLAAQHQVDTVTAYFSVGDEPETGPLLAGLRALGVTILLPIVTPHRILDWAEYSDGETRQAGFGLREPTGRALGPDAIQSAGLIICPGVAASPRGDRLGRGGGYYDGALSRALPSSLRCLLLYDDEVLESVPAEPHDQPVDIVVTPRRLLHASPGRGAAVSP